MRSSFLQILFFEGELFDVLVDLHQDLLFVVDFALGVFEFALETLSYFFVAFELLEKFLELLEFFVFPLELDL